jgi:hypothetical protein
MKNGQNEARLMILRGPYRSKKALNKRKYSVSKSYCVFQAAAKTKLYPPKCCLH